MRCAEVSSYKSPNYPETYGDLLDWAIERVENPERKILFQISDSDIKITYADFGRNVNRISNMFLELSMKKGDQVAIFLPNCIEYAYLLHSLSKCGAVMVVINPFLRGEPLRYILDHSDSKFLVTSHDLFLDKIHPFINLLKNIKSVFFIDQKAEMKTPESMLFGDYINYSVGFKGQNTVSGNDIQGIWYTSGTTGPPKGVVIRHKAYMWRTLFFAHYFRLTAETVNYYVLPMYHAGLALTAAPLVMAVGGEIVQVKWFSASNFWKDVVKYHATFILTTGTIIPILLRQPITPEEIEGRNLIRLWVGAPIDERGAVTKRWPGIKLLDFYGTTEVPMATIADYENPKVGNTCGTMLKLINPETGQEILERNRAGEIVLGHELGPEYIIKEYYKDPEKSKEMIKDGWWYSGDLGMLDEKGKLIFVDRIKDYLRIGGENVSSAVVEDVIRKYPSVAEVAIVGVKGDLGHDEMIAHLILKEGTSIEPKGFFEFCNKNLSYFMIPRYLIIRSEMPKTHTLRIEKYKLRDEKLFNAIDRVKLGIELRR